MNPWTNRYAPKVGGVGTSNFSTMPLEMDITIGTNISAYVIVMPGMPDNHRIFSWNGTDGSPWFHPAMPMLDAAPKPLSVQSRRAGLKMHNLTPSKSLGGLVSVLVLPQGLELQFQNSLDLHINAFTMTQFDAILTNHPDTRTLTGTMFAHGQTFVLPQATKEGYEHHRLLTNPASTGVDASDFQAAIHLAMKEAPPLCNLLLKLHGFSLAQSYSFKYLEQSNLRFAAHTVVATMATVQGRGQEDIYAAANAAHLGNPSSPTVITI